MIKIADERLNKVSHLTVKETATLLRLLQGDWEFVVRPTMQDCKEPQSVEQEARSSRGVIPFNHSVAKDKSAFSMLAVSARIAVAEFFGILFAS